MSSVSVVIPCYNYGRYLPEAVGSVLSNQPGVDVRVLIIDDAVPDDSAQVAKEIAAADPRVELRVHTANQGGIATYNEGIIDWADGDYTVLLSADDQFTPGALTRATEFMDAHPSVGFVYGHPLHFVQGQPLPAARTAVPGSSVWSGQSWLEKRFRDGKSSQAWHGFGKGTTFGRAAKLVRCTCALAPEESQDAAERFRHRRIMLLGGAAVYRRDKNLGISQPLRHCQYHGITVILYAVPLRSRQESPSAKQSQTRNRIRGSSGDLLPSLLPGSAVGLSRAVPRHRLGGKAALHGDF